jgi:hypothetical protein
MTMDKLTMKGSVTCLRHCSGSQLADLEHFLLCVASSPTQALKHNCYTDLRNHLNQETVCP